MRVSDRGICEIAAHEGIVPYPYLDSVGVWTCGIGHTASAGAPDPRTLPNGKPIPLDDVFAIFRRDLARFETRVNAAVKVPLAQHEFDALVSFDFNTGGIHKAKLTEHLNRGDRASAADGFMGWLKPPEITDRRTKEQALFRDGTYSSGGRATLYRADDAGRVLWHTGERVDVMEAIRGRAAPKPPSKTEDVGGAAVGTGLTGLAAWLAAEGATALAIIAGVAVVCLIGFMIWRHRKRKD